MLWLTLVSRLFRGTNSQSISFFDTTLHRLFLPCLTRKVYIQSPTRLHIRCPKRQRKAAGRRQKPNR